MNHARTRRLAAGAVAATMIAGLLTMLAWSPAQANHGGFKLEVFREVTSESKTTDVVLTARIVDENGAPPALGDGGGINIDFEVESGPGDTEGGAVTRTSPDYTCDTVDQSLGGAARCTVEVESGGGGGTAGVSIIRAWIDHDGSNATVEADPTEGRLSDASTDCFTELPINGGASNNSDYEACTSDADGPETPGGAAERDTTDVVKIIFNNNAPIRVDCPELTEGPVETEIKVTCTVTDTDGLRRGGVVFDGVHQTGANDINGDGPDDGDAADYQDFESNSNGGVTFTIETAAEPGFETGPATICVWYSSDNGDDNDLGTGTPLDDPSYDSTGGEGDGGLCATGADTEAAPPGDTAANATERFVVEWDAAVLTTLDVSPEVDASTVGTQRSVTATALDQFGRQWTTAVTVNFELLAGSVGDQDAGSTMGSPDLTCNTPGTGGNPGQCSRTYTSSAVGTDTICAWLPSKVTPNASCNGETRDGNEGGAFIDVVQKSWSAAPAPTTTTTTTTTTPKPEEVAKDQGYTLVGADGGIFTFGSAQFHGSTGDIKLNKPIIGMANKKGGTGYWLVASDGGIFSFGDADFYGSTGDKTLNAPILGMEATPSGKGYYLFAADGGIFTFGDADFYGSTGDMKLNAPAVGMAVNEKGDGYWLVAQDGGIFSFGNVPFHGSTGDMKLNQPVFDMAPTAGDKGYWLLAKDGGLFSFGDAGNKFAGSGVGSVSGTAIGMGTTPTTNGYWIADSRGAVFAFGDARFLGDRRANANNAATVGFATVPK